MAIFHDGDGDHLSDPDGLECQRHRHAPAVKPGGTGSTQKPVMKRQHRRQGDGGRHRQTELHADGETDETHLWNSRPGNAG